MMHAGPVRNVTGRCALEAVLGKRGYGRIQQLTLCSDAAMLLLAGPLTAARDHFLCHIHCNRRTARRAADALVEREHHADGSASLDNDAVA